MSHPFDLNLSALESIKLNFAEELTDEEAATVVGGRNLLKKPKVKDKEDIIYTTLAVGEEDGGEVTTMALGEEGGHL